MLKILMVISVLSCCTILGTKISNSYLRRQKLFFDYVNFCNNFSANLDFFRKSVEEFAFEFCKNLESDFSKIVYAKLNGQDFFPQKYFWSKKSLLTQQEKQYSNAFFDILGKGDAVSQKSQIASFKAYFVKCLSEAEQNYTKNGRMYSKLGVLAGLFVAILII